MIEYFELAVRWIFAGQMLFWGLNGFFHFLALPPSDPVINRFTESCIETRFIMPTVKILEVVGGFFLLLNIAVPLVLVLFAPVVFVITGLHLIHNKKPWGLLASITLPFLLLLFFHHEALLRITH